MKLEHKINDVFDLYGEGMNAYARCKHCGQKQEFKLPEELRKLVEEAGGQQWMAVHNFFEHQHKDDCFSGWDLKECHLCGKKRVLVFYWTYYSTGPDVIVACPSECIRINLGDKIKQEIWACKFCKDKAEANPQEYKRKIANIILKKQKVKS